MKLADLKVHIRRFCQRSILLDNLYKGASKCKRYCKRYALYILPDSAFLKYRFRVKTGETLDLVNPQTFNMKIQWLTLNDRNPLYTSLADKYAVREYVENRAGGYS